MRTLNGFMILSEGTGLKGRTCQRFVQPSFLSGYATKNCRKESNRQEMLTFFRSNLDREALGLLFWKKKFTDLPSKLNTLTHVID